MRSATTYLAQEEELLICCSADEVPSVVLGFQELSVIQLGHCLLTPAAIKQKYILTELSTDGFVT